jgi:hypothetical protein
MSAAFADAVYFFVDLCIFFLDVGVARGLRAGTENPIDPAVCSAARRIPGKTYGGGALR